MKCLVCNYRMKPYFSKRFDCLNLGKVDYEKCRDCGFVFSRTHFEMDKQDWENLNFQYHTQHRNSDQNPDDPRWITRLQNQADLISKLNRAGILSKENCWVDYACGDGKLADLLDQRGIEIKKFDLYIDNPTYLIEDELFNQKFSFVINTSLFEHILERKTVDDIIDLLDENGVLALHTLVCEEVPQDPNWFYLLPVHTAFFTNRSMEILFNSWGFKSSIYSPDAQMWFMSFRLKEEYTQVLNQSIKNGILISKNGFVDYWKQLPYRIN